MTKCASHLAFSALLGPMCILAMAQPKPLGPPSLSGLDLALRQARTMGRDSSSPEAVEVPALREVGASSTTSRRYRVDLPDGSAHRFALRRVRQTLETQMSVWSGTNPENGGVFVLVEQGGRAAGVVEIPFGGTFEFFTHGDGRFTIRELDDSIRSCGVTASTLRPPITPPVHERAQSVGDSAACNLDDGTFIDLMIVYTPSVLASFGFDVVDLQLSLESWVEIANLYFENSLVATRLRLVHIEEVAYTESGDSFLDLERLQGQADGFLDEVHPLRDLHGADLVSLRTTNGDHGGVATVPLSLPLSHEASFSTFNNGGSLPHELGHNFGCRHDRADTPEPGLFEYSHGYLNPEPGGAWKTLMGVGLTHATVGHFSNPAVSFLGAPTGIAAGEPNSADCASTVNNISSVVAAVRPTAWQDCNINGFHDTCDLLDGGSEDCNQNRVPDECDLETGSLTLTYCGWIPDQCFTASAGLSIAPPSPASAAVFGDSLAAADDLVVVGDPFWDAETRPDAGTVHVYRRTVTGLVFEATLQPVDAPVDRLAFGASVATDGTRIAVSAVSPTGSATAYVFSKTASGWEQEQKLAPSPHFSPGELKKAALRAINPIAKANLSFTEEQPYGDRV